LPSKALNDAVLTIQTLMLVFLLVRVVIKGDHGTGKTALFHRLSGKAPPSEYAPTKEIQISHIHWDYKSTSSF